MKSVWENISRLPGEFPPPPSPATRFIWDLFFSFVPCQKAAKTVTHKSLCLLNVEAFGLRANNPKIKQLLLLQVAPLKVQRPLPPDPPNVYRFTVLLSSPSDKTIKRSYKHRQTDTQKRVADPFLGNRVDLEEEERLWKSGETSRRQGHATFMPVEAIYSQTPDFFKHPPNDFDFIAIGVPYKTTRLDYWKRTNWPATTTAPRINSPDSNTQLLLLAPHDSWNETSILSSHKKADQKTRLEESSPWEFAQPLDLNPSKQPVSQDGPENKRKEGNILTADPSDEKIRRRGVMFSLDGVAEDACRDGGEIQNEREERVQKSIPYLLAVVLTDGGSLGFSFLMRKGRIHAMSIYLPKKREKKREKSARPTRQIHPISVVKNLLTFLRQCRRLLLFIPRHFPKPRLAMA
ncbi:unnamed protein product [Caenorhabditis auriculariae]|uniref:Uncharacterized protein n=1 Tax=Caenorhabditis auriculariae TaxID=2777116 RepID=A0A8S1HRS4_9PELO|nr:unnamed protein product [Caenorhabditis auriculariae]